MSNVRKSNNRSKSRNRKNISKSAEFQSKGKGVQSAYDADGRNDVQWYASDSQLLKDAASIPYSWAVGTDIHLDMEGVTDESSQSQVIPGVIAHYLVPSVGYTTNASDPINLASTAIYSFVRHANSGHSNYDSSDLMIYLLAMTQIYSYINYLQRVYGTAMLYSQQNRYMPRALLRAMSVDPDSIVSNLANFRAGINVFINKVASLAVPNTMSIFPRQAFLYQNVYMEGPSLKDQMYLYSPAGFWGFDLDSDGAGQLVLSKFGLTDPEVSDVGYRVASYSWDKLLAFGNKLLDQLFYDEDFNIMSGDILKAYGTNGIIKLQSLPENYVCVPIYNSTVLEQFQNATILPHFDYTSGYVTQSPNKAYLISKPSIHYAQEEDLGKSIKWIKCIQALDSNRIITTANPDASPELTMEITRLTVAADNVVIGATSTGAKTIDVRLHPGSELVVCTKVYTISPNTSPIPGIPGPLDIQGIVPSDGFYEASTSHMFVRLSPFKYHPTVISLVINVGASLDATHVKIDGIIQDVDNYAVLNDQDLSKLNTAALLNEFNVPRLSKI